MADLYAKYLICSGSGGYKNLKFVANCVILRQLVNKLNPVFILEKNQLLFGKNNFVYSFLNIFFFKIHFYNVLLTCASASVTLSGASP